MLNATFTHSKNDVSFFRRARAHTPKKEDHRPPRPIKVKNKKLKNKY